MSAWPIARTVRSVAPGIEASLAGRLVADPEVRVSAGGVRWLRLLVAVRGAGEVEVLVVDPEAIRRLAGLGKGRRLAVEGTLRPTVEGGLQVVAWLVEPIGGAVPRLGKPHERARLGAPRVEMIE